MWPCLGGREHVGTGRLGVVGVRHSLESCVCGLMGMGPEAREYPACPGVCPSSARELWWSEQKDDHDYTAVGGGWGVRVRCCT